MTSSRLAVFATLVEFSTLARYAAAQWTPLGVPVCSDSCVASGHYVIPDGTGGAYVAWRESRDYPVTDDDVYAQRITVSGMIAAGWPPAGLAVCVVPRPQAPLSIAPDGEGGLLVAWYDHRNVDAGLSQDIYAQRILGDGTIAPGWPVGGAPATRALDYQHLPVVSTDGAGGAFIAWSDWRDYGSIQDVYVQHLTLVGAPAPG